MSRGLIQGLLSVSDITAITGSLNAFPHVPDRAGCFSRGLPSRERGNGHVEARRESAAESPFVQRSSTPGQNVRVDDGAWSTSLHPEGRPTAQRQATTASHQLRRNVVAHRRCLANPGLVPRELEDILYREDSDLLRRHRRRSDEAAGEGVGVETHLGGASLVLDSAERVQIGGGQGWL